MASTSASPSMFHCSSSVFYAKGYTENMYTVSLEVPQAPAALRILSTHQDVRKTLKKRA